MRCFQSSFPALVDENGGVVEAVAVLLVESDGNHDAVLAGERGNAVTVGSGDRRGEVVRIGVLPAEDGGFRECGDVGVPGLGRLERVLNAAEVALAVAVDHQDLAEGDADGVNVGSAGSAMIASRAGTIMSHYNREPSVPSIKAAGSWWSPAESDSGLRKDHAQRTGARAD